MKIGINSELQWTFFKYFYDCIVFFLTKLIEKEISPEVIDKIMFITNASYEFEQRVDAYNILISEAMKKSVAKQIPRIQIILETVLTVERPSLISKEDFATIYELPDYDHLFNNLLATILRRFSIERDQIQTVPLASMLAYLLKLFDDFDSILKKMGTLNLQMLDKITANYPKITD